MINIVAYHNSIGGAYEAAQKAMTVIGAQVGTRICSKRPYNSQLPDWTSLREYGAQLVSLEVASGNTRELIEELELDFQNPGFPGKVAIVIYHHDDPQSEAVAKFIKWRLARLIDPNLMSPRVGSRITPPNIPIFDALAVNFKVCSIDAVDLPNGGADYATSQVPGTFIPTTTLNHDDRARLFGHGEPIDRTYVPHPPQLDKSITAAFIPKDNGYAVCAMQFNQMSYANTLGEVLWLTPHQMIPYFTVTASRHFAIMSGDTPIDLFYEMLFLLFNGELDF